VSAESKANNKISKAYLLINQSSRLLAAIGYSRLPPNKTSVVPYIFAIVAAVGMLLPIVYLFIRGGSINESTITLLLRPQTLNTLFRTVVLTATVTISSVMIGVPLAWLLTRTDLPLRKMWIVLAFLPLAIPSYVAGFIVMTAIGPRGLLQQLLSPIGVDRLPEIYGFPGAAITLTLLTYPYVFMTVRSAITRLDPALEEASSSLGKSPKETFFQITLHLLRPAILSGALLVSLYTVSDFGAVSLMRYQTFTWSIYLQYEAGFNHQSAATLCIVLLLIAIPIVYIESRMRGHAKYFRSASGAARPLKPIRLGRWTFFATLFCSGLVFASLLIPASVLIYWLIRGVDAGNTLVPIWHTAWNSFYVSILAAAIIIGISFPIASLTARQNTKLARAIEQLSYLGFALPGIVIGLSLVFFGIRLVNPLYQTMFMLILAYSILFMAPAIGTLRASLQQINPHVEEAARGLGASPFRTLLKITLPLTKPGLIAGFSLIFVLTIKELPATLILSPIGFMTLAGSIWSAASEAFFTRAAHASLILILLSSLPLAFATIRNSEDRW